MLTVASKSRPALVSARSSFNASSSTSSSRAASTVATGDIFDVPGRMIFEDDITTGSSPTSSRRYQPSHFRPLPAQKSANSPSTAAATVPHQHHASQAQPLSHSPHVRHMSTFAHYRPTADGLSVLFDGPARPRQPPRVTSRHSSARAVSSTTSSPAPLNPFDGVDMRNYVPPSPLPEPVIFDGPARPRRKVPAQLRKSSQNGAKSQSSAVVGAIAGLLSLGGAYEVYEAQHTSEYTPKNVLSFSRSRESLASRELQDEEDAESKDDVLRDEVFQVML